MARRTRNMKGGKALESKRTKAPKNYTPKAAKAPKKMKTFEVTKTGKSTKQPLELEAKGDQSGRRRFFDGTENS